MQKPKVGSTRLQILKSLGSTTRVPGALAAVTAAGPCGDRGAAPGECRAHHPTYNIMQSPVPPCFPALLWEPSELAKWNRSATFKSYWHSREALLDINTLGVTQPDQHKDLNSFPGQVLSKGSLSGSGWSQTWIQVPAVPLGTGVVSTVSGPRFPHSTNIFGCVFIK